MSKKSYRKDNQHRSSSNTKPEIGLERDTSSDEAAAFFTPECVDDLLSEIHFDMESGKIWLGGQRMLLNHANSLWRMREEIRKSFGNEVAKYLFFRYGYYAGIEDAEIAKKLRPDLSWKEAYLAGPQLHSIRGMVKVVPDEMKVDFEHGKFFASFDWYNSFEVACHKKVHGLSDVPVCHTLLGYASGYTSYFFGRQIAFKEVQCSGTGASHCRIEGRLIEEWKEDTDLKKYFNIGSLNTELFERRSDFDEIKRQNSSLQINPKEFFSAIGESKSFKIATELILKVANTKATVLLQGETGVGKEVFAKALHEASERRHKPFIAINCASIPTELIESELFGVEKGAYTGAIESRKGKIEAAHEGTLFLDEVVELSPRAQSSLLRVLQEQSLNRVGSNLDIKVDIRIIVASNEDLLETVNLGKFRKDLYYRLSTFPVYIPPLRERDDDVLLLAKFFLQKYTDMYMKNIKGFTDKAREYLTIYDWPGNVRELQNTIERAVILNEGRSLIQSEDLLLSGVSSKFISNSNKHIISSKSGSLEPKIRDENEKILDDLLDDEFDLEAFNNIVITRAVEKCGGNISQASRMLNMSRAKLDYRLSKLGLDSD